jgi:hypothetical protein
LFRGFADPVFGSAPLERAAEIVRCVSPYEAGGLPMTTRRTMAALSIGFLVLSRCGSMQHRGASAQTVVDTKPFIALEPSAAQPATSVSVSGSGFDGDCAVRLSLDETADIARPEVGRSGTFQAAFRVPADAAEGVHEVVAQGVRAGVQGCSDPSGRVASARLSVTGGGEAGVAVLTVDTVEARPGSLVHVSGRGFCAADGCSPVTIYISGQVSARNVRVGPGGTFTTPAAVPAVDTAGHIHVVAVQSGPGESEIRASSELRVTPRPNTPRQLPQ